MSELGDLIDEAKRVGITSEELARIKTKHRLRKIIEYRKGLLAYLASKEKTGSAS